jgi:hypothetical protein
VDEAGDEVWIFEQEPDLALGCMLDDEAIVQDVAERPAALVFALDVRADPNARSRDGLEPVEGTAEDTVRPRRARRTAPAFARLRRRVWVWGFSHSHLDLTYTMS